MEDGEHRLRALAAGIRQLAMQRSLRDLAEVAARTVLDAVDAERARCIFYDRQENLLWVEAGGSESVTEWPASTGLAGEAASCGRPCATTCARTSATWEATIDDPVGRGDDRLFAQPIATASGDVHAVVVVARTSRQPVFDSDDARRLAEWAQSVAPLFHAHLLEILAENAATTAPAGVFRDGAFSGRSSPDPRGAPPWCAPAWTRWAHAVALAFLAGSIAFLSLARVREYAAGPAVVVAGGHLDVTATAAGVVEHVLAEPGQCVERGAALAELHAAAERADLERAERELEWMLGARLLDPADEALEDAVARARVETSRARERLEEKTMKAPAAGCIGDVRLVAGRAVAAGQTVATLATHAEAPRVWVFVPGRYGPSLAVGQALRLQLDGFAHASQHLRITAVVPDVVGPAEMQRIVGPQLADAIAMQGPMVRVEAQLASTTFVSDGEQYRLSDGMVGVAEIPVRDSPAVFALFPGLEDAFDD